MTNYNDFQNKKAQFAFIVPKDNEVDSYLACAAVINSMDAEIIGLIEAHKEEAIIEKKLDDSLEYAKKAISMF